MQSKSLGDSRASSDALEQRMVLEDDEMRVLKTLRYFDALEDEVNITLLLRLWTINLSSN